MISFLADGFNQIISMFLSWFGVLEGASADIASLSAGGVLALIPALALIAVAATFIVSVVVRVVSAISFDHVSLMHHVDGHMREGIGAVRSAQWVGFWNTVYFQRFLKRLNAKNKKKAAAAGKPLPEDQFRPIHEGTSADLPWASYEIGADAPGQVIDFSGYAKLPPVASAAMSLTKSGVLLGKYAKKAMAEAKSSEGETGMQDGGPEQITYGGEVHNRVSGNVYEKPMSQPEPVAPSGPDIIDTTGHTVGDGKYIGPA